MRKSRLQYTKPSSSHHSKPNPPPRPKFRDDKDERRSYLPYGADIDRDRDRDRDRSDEDRASYFCDVCKQQMSSKAIYESHCQSAFHKENAKKAAPTGTGQVWECSTCQKKFSVKIAVDRHCLLYKHQPLYRIEGVPKKDPPQRDSGKDQSGSGQSPLRKMFSFGPLLPPNYCDVCKVDCMNPSNLRIHLESWRHRAAVDKQKDEEKAKEKEAKKEQEKEANKLDEQKGNKSNEQEAKETDEQEVKREEESETKKTENQEESTKERKSVAKNGKDSQDPEKIFMCDVCSISCNARGAYIDHVAGKKHRKNVSSMRPPYNCVPCDRRYTIEKDFNAHYENERHLETLGMGLSKSGKARERLKSSYGNKSRGDSREKTTRYRSRSSERSEKRYKDSRRQRNRDRSSSGERNMCRKDSQEKVRGRSKESNRKMSPEESSSGSEEDVLMKNTGDHYARFKKEKGLKESPKKKNITDDKESKKVNKGFKKIFNEDDNVDDDEDRKVEIKDDDDEEVHDLREKLNKGKNIVITKKVKDEDGIDVLSDEQRTVSESNQQTHVVKDEEGSVDDELFKIRHKSDLLMREQLLKEHNIEILRYKESEDEYKRLCLEEGFLKRRLDLFREDDPRRENDLADLLRVERAIREVREELAVRDMMIQEKERYLIVLKNRMEGKTPGSGRSSTPVMRPSSPPVMRQTPPPDARPSSALSTGRAPTPLSVIQDNDNQAGTDNNEPVDLRTELEKERLIKRIGPELNNLDPALRQRILDALYVAESASANQSINDEPGYNQPDQSTDLRKELSHSRASAEPAVQDRDLRKTLIDLIQEVPKQQLKQQQQLEEQQRQFEQQQQRYKEQQQLREQQLQHKEQQQQLKQKSSSHSKTDVSKRQKAFESSSSSFESDSEERVSKKKKISSSKKKNEKDKSEKRKRGKNVDGSPDSYRESSRKKVSASQSTSKSASKRRHRSRSPSSSPEERRSKKSKYRKKEETDRKKKHSGSNDSESRRDKKKQTKPLAADSSIDDNKIQNISIVSKKRHHISALKIYDDDDDEEEMGNVDPDRVPVRKELVHVEAQNVPVTQPSSRPREQFAMWKSAIPNEDGNRGDTREDIWEDALGPGPRSTSDAMPVDIFGSIVDDTPDYMQGKLHALQKPPQAPLEGAAPRMNDPPMYASPAVAVSAERRMRIAEANARYMMEQSRQQPQANAPSKLPGIFETLLAPHQPNAQQSSQQESNRIQNAQTDGNVEKPKVKRGILKKPSQKFLEQEKELMGKEKAERERNEGIIPGLAIPQATAQPARAFEAPAQGAPQRLLDAPRQFSGAAHLSAGAPPQSADLPPAKETVGPDTAQGGGISSKDLEKINFILNSFRNQYGSDWDSSQIEAELKKALVEKQGLKPVQKPPQENAEEQWQRERQVPAMEKASKEMPQSASYNEALRGETRVPRGSSEYDYRNINAAEQQPPSSSQTKPLFPIKTLSSALAKPKPQMVEGLTIRREEQEADDEPLDFRKDRYLISRSVEKLYQQPISSDNRHLREEPRQLPPTSRQNVPDSFPRIEEKEPRIPVNTNTEPEFAQKTRYEVEDERSRVAGTSASRRVEDLEPERGFRPVVHDQLPERERVLAHPGVISGSHPGSREAEARSYGLQHVESRDSRLLEDPSRYVRQEHQQITSEHPREAQRSRELDPRMSWDGNYKEAARTGVALPVDDRRRMPYREDYRERDYHGNPRPSRGMEHEHYRHEDAYRYAARHPEADRFPQDKQISRERVDDRFERPPMSEVTPPRSLSWRMREPEWGGGLPTTSRAYEASVSRYSQPEQPKDFPTPKSQSVADSDRDEMRFQSRPRALVEAAGENEETEKTVHAHSQDRTEAAAKEESASAMPRPAQQTPIPHGNPRAASSLDPVKMQSPDEMCAPDGRNVPVERQAPKEDRPSDERRVPGESHASVEPGSDKMHAPVERPFPDARSSSLERRVADDRHPIHGRPGLHERPTPNERHSSAERSTSGDRRPFPARHTSSDRHSSSERRNPMDRNPTEERRAPDERRLPVDRHGFDERRYPDERRMLAERRTLDERYPPADRRGLDDRRAPYERRGLDERLAPDARLLPTDRRGPDERRMGDERRYPDERRAPDEQYYPDDRRAPEERRGPDDRFPSADRNARVPRPGIPQRGMRPSRTPFDNRGRGNIRPRGSYNPHAGHY